MRRAAPDITGKVVLVNMAQFIDTYVYWRVYIDRVNGRPGAGQTFEGRRVLLPSAGPPWATRFGESLRNVPCTLIEEVF